MKITVLHSSDTRNSGFYTDKEALVALSEGKYYAAGTVDVGPSSVHNMLDQAWNLTQNDVHPNALRDVDGSIVTEDIRTMDESDLEYLMSMGAKPLPAVWNGEFAQRSSQTGDVFVIKGATYRVSGVGFERIGHAPEGGYTLGANDYDKRFDSAINTEFDNLVFRGA